MRVLPAFAFLIISTLLATAQTLTVSGEGIDRAVLDRAKVEALGVTDIRITREIATQSGAQKSETVYSGIELPKLLEAQGIEKLDRHGVRAATILVIAHDGYRASFSWGELFNAPAGKQVMLILKEDGSPLPAKAGAFTLRAFGDLRPGPRHVRDVAEIRVVMPQ